MARWPGGGRDATPGHREGGDPSSRGREGAVSRAQARPLCPSASLPTGNPKPALLQTCVTAPPSPCVLLPEALAEPRHLGREGPRTPVTMASKRGAPGPAHPPSGRAAPPPGPPWPQAGGPLLERTACPKPALTLVLTPADHRCPSPIVRLPDHTARAASAGQVDRGQVSGDEAEESRWGT